MSSAPFPSPGSYLFMEYLCDSKQDKTADIFKGGTASILLLIVYV